MPVKATGPAEEPAYIPWHGGFTWIAHPEEGMERASHAIGVDGAGELVDDDRRVEAVWVVEPVDAAGLDRRLADLGPVAGVVVLAGFHRRDAAAVARRHDVSVHLPATVAGLAGRIDAPTEVFEGRLADTALVAIPVLEGIPWSEAVLHDPATGTLVATEVLVTSDRATGPAERLAVGPYARLLPPRDALADLEVARVLVGHGPPVTDRAREALDAALRSSYRGFPAYLSRNIGFMLKSGVVALWD